MQKKRLIVFIQRRDFNFNSTYIDWPKVCLIKSLLLSKITSIVMLKNITLMVGQQIIMFSKLVCISLTSQHRELCFEYIRTDNYNNSFVFKLFTEYMFVLLIGRLSFLALRILNCHVYIIFNKASWHEFI